MKTKSQQKNIKEVYFDMGIPVVRVAKAIRGQEKTGKNPLITGWNKVSCTRQQVIAWQGNIAFRLDNFVVLDIDNSEEFSVIFGEKLSENCPMVFRGNERDARDGMENAHFYFKKPKGYNESIRKITNKDGSVVAELRSGSGALCVVPESTHHDGSTYKWSKFNLLSPKDLIDIPKKFLDIFDSFEKELSIETPKENLNASDLDEIVRKVLSQTSDVANSYQDFVKISLAFKAGGYEYSQVDCIFKNSAGYNEKQNRYLYNKMRENGNITMKTAYFIAQEKNPGLLKREMDAHFSRQKQSTNHFIQNKSEVKAMEEIIYLEKPEKKSEVTFDWSSLPFIGDFVDVVSGSTDAPNEFIACSFISALCGAIGNKAYLHFGSGRIAPNLWLAIIGKSSALRKTTAMNIGTKILRGLDKEKREEYAKELSEYLNDKENNIAPEEKLNVYPVGVTAERLIEILSQKPDGIFCFSELAQFLKMVDKHSGLKENMTALYDYNDTPLSFETKTQGKYTVKDTAINIVGCSTIEWLQKNLDDSDLMTGFLARFIFSVIREETKERIAFPEKLIIPNRFEALMRFLDVNLFQEVELTTEAKDYYISWFNQYSEITKDESNMVKASLIRLETVALKLSIMFHCLECYGKNNVAKYISSESVKLACTLTYNYFAQNILSCYDELTKSVDMTETKITDIIRKKGKKKTLQDGQEVVMVARYIVSQYSRIKKKELDEYIDTMVSKNYLTIHQNGSRTYLCVKS